MANYKVDLYKIKAFAFDVDGVLTDGSVMSMPDGELVRSFSSKDGFAIRMARSKGYPIAIITGGNSKSIENRAKHLGLDNSNLYQKIFNKAPYFENFCKKYNLKHEEVAYVGDDIPDIPVLKICGLAVCPNDAVQEVKDVCHYISRHPGGRGVARELIEQVLKMQDNWVYDPETFRG